MSNSSGSARRSVVVASVPRSGTHLAIDLLRNNHAGYGQPYVSVPRRWGRLDVRGTQSLLRRIHSCARVFKTHELPGRFIHPVGPQGELFGYLASHALFVYVVRDGRDVLVSQFLRAHSEEIAGAERMSSFLEEQVRVDEVTMTRVEAWAHHVDSWLNQTTLSTMVVRFADMIERPRDEVSRVATRLECELLPSFRDARLREADANWTPRRFQNRPVTREQVERTAIDFRRGAVGDYMSMLTVEDLRQFDRYTAPYPACRAFCKPTDANGSA